MNSNTLFAEIGYWLRDTLCRLRRHSEDPRHKGFCRCGEFQPSRSGVPMTCSDDWDDVSPTAEPSSFGVRDRSPSASMGFEGGEHKREER
jgi:hypothetical protein